MRKIYYLSFICILLSQNSYAENVGNLKECIEYALKHNPLFIADRHRVVQANAMIEVAKGRYKPNAVISSGFTRSNAPGDYFGIKLNQRGIKTSDFNTTLLNNPDFINNYQTRLDVSLPIYEGGALRAKKKQAIWQLDSAEFNHEFVRQQLILRTLTAYIHVLQARAEIEAMQVAVDAAKKRYKDTEALYQRGILVESSVMDANVHLLHTKLKLKETENNYEYSIDVLRYVMGVNINTLLLFSDAFYDKNIPYIVQLPEQSIDELKKLALASRQDLKSIKSLYESSKAAISYAKSDFFPHVDTMVRQEWNSNSATFENRNSLIILRLKMNLFSGGADAAELHASRVKLLEIENRVIDLKQIIVNEVADAWRLLKESNLRQESEFEALKQSEESLRIKLLLYKQGLATTTNLLDAQLQVDQTRLASINSKYNFLISQAILLSTVGVLSEDKIQ